MKFHKQLFTALFTVTIVIALFHSSSCAPPPSSTESEDTIAQARLDSLRKFRCPRLLSSAAEYYKNKDWENTVRVYKEVVDLGCDRGLEEEVFQYWAVGYEYLGKFDSSEYVLLQGLKRLPDDLFLHQRLAFAYKRLGDKEKEIREYERIIELIPDDTEPLKRLSELYYAVGMYEEQIYILGKILEIEPNNLNAQSDKVSAYEKIGKDPLDIFRERVEEDPENVTFVLDLCDKLMNVGEYNEAIKHLSRIVRSKTNSSPVTKKLVLKKLSQAYYKNDQLEEAVGAYKQLFERDPRDFRTALEIVRIDLDILRFNDALQWANKAIRIVPDNGETYGTKGLVYYKAFQECRKDYPTIDDKIVAALAHQYFLKAEEKKYRSMMRNRKWLEDNDVIFGKSEWFMLDDELKRGGKISVSGDCYSWVKEGISKQSDW